MAFAGLDDSLFTIQAATPANPRQAVWLSELLGGSLLSSSTRLWRPAPTCGARDPPMAPMTNVFPRGMAMGPHRGGMSAWRPPNDL